MAIEKDKSIVATEIVDALNKKVSTSDALAFTDILTGSDLTGKVASAGAVKTLNENTQTNFLRGRSVWLQNNETHRYHVNTPGSFVFATFGTSASQWSLYYINNQPPGYVHKVLGEGSQPTVTFNNNTELIISNTVGWIANYFLIGEFTRL